jgi:hypothetical protein
VCANSVEVAVCRTATEQAEFVCGKGWSGENGVMCLRCDARRCWACHAPLSIARLPRSQVNVRHSWDISGVGTRAEDFMSSEATRRCSCLPCVENRIDTTSFRSSLMYCRYVRAPPNRRKQGGFIPNDRRGECLVIVRAREKKRNTRTVPSAIAAAVLPPLDPL